jgi:hypothetical protein
MIEGVVVPKNPMVGSFPACCARAASGHTTAAPPSSVVNSRRFNLNVRSPVGAQQGRRGHRRRGLRRVEIDHESKFGRSLNRKTGRLFTPKDVIDIRRGTLEQSAISTS